jgi:RNA polymerase sigma factor (sigma-70 family)
MEASALHAPALGRRPLAAPLLRLRSDEQLVALFRAGSEEAFATIHDRYRQRLFAYVRQMLSAATRSDAEDVLQDVFMRAYGALRADGRDVNLRAWLYRVAHNRCVDHLRRPTPPAADVFDLSRTPLQDPLETAQRRDDLRRLVADVGRLPDQQRSALLMREIDGLPYVDIAAALDVTVPAVKSLLVRARVGLVEAAEARDTDCAVIREDLAGAFDRGVKASGRARRHMRECDACREYRGALRDVKRSFAALTPAAGLGPLALAAKALGLGGGSAGIVGGAGAAGSGVAACKVAAVVCTAVVATSGAAVEVRHELAPATHAHHRAAQTHAAAAVAAPVPTASPPVSTGTILRRTDTAGAPVAEQRPATHARHGAAKHGAATAHTEPTDTTPATTTTAVTGAGGTSAPADEAAPTTTATKPPAPDAAPPSGSGGNGALSPAGSTGAPAAPEADAAAPAAPTDAPPVATGPPPEH